MQRDPERVEAARDLTKTYEALGLLYLKMNQNESASTYLTKAETVAQRSTAHDPDNVRVRKRLEQIRAEHASIPR